MMIPALFVLGVLNGVLYYVYVWQLKEYRLDRLMDMMSTRTGLARAVPFFLWSKWVIFGLVGLIALVMWRADILILWQLVFLTDIVDLMHRFMRRKLFRPDMTFKALSIMGMTVGLCLVLAWLAGFEWLYLMIILLFIGDLTSLMVFAFAPVTLFLKNRIIRRARLKMEKMKDLKVIGITGSYGKSSTKEFLYHIVSQQFRAFKTPGNVNVDVGVANVVLRDLLSDHEVMICEMGAYKKGEIKKICDLVSPMIGIVTAVKDSHLSLFGSFENLKDAKYELPDSLPSNGLSIMNQDVAGSAELADRLGEKCRVMRYSQVEGELMAKDVVVREEEIEFTFLDQKFVAPLFGRQNISNLLAAILAARELGMELVEIAKSVRTVKPPPRTMELRKGPKSWVIDDSYNANPDGVAAALDYLKIFEDRYKVIVFPGMLELGPKTASEHQRIAQKIAEICDYAIFTSTDYEKSLRQGLGDLSEDRFSFLKGDQNEIGKLLKAKIKQKNAIVLFESRGAENVMKKLLDEK